ncbi:MAG: hypothetical protein HYX68_11690 [Planctomycetes bacterium]|nr:hypothetical protein [Planctomycetota bacterium]
MAVKTRKAASVWALLHFVVRFLGLNAVVAIAVGAFLWQALDLEAAGMIVIIAGASVVALALLAEIRGVTQTVFSRRGAAGINGVLQIALATALFVGGNIYSYYHYHRCDCTADRHFTLDPDIKKQLAKLRGDTDIIIYLQHVSFGQRSELRQDEYDQAAERKIIEKVKDLAEQFQELGPRFRVHILDTQQRSYQNRERELKKISENLVTTIKAAPEDTIFFYTRDTKQVQRLSFNDIYQLDKKASQEANGGKGNLVLIDQGVQNFANKIFKIEEKKPRIGFAVIHGVLGQDGTEELGMTGLKKALASRGFVGRDIVLKKWPQREPAALEHEENRYEILESQKNYFERELRDLGEELKAYQKSRDYWQTKSAREINEEYALVEMPVGPRPVPRKQIEAIRRTGRLVFARDVTEEFRAVYNSEWKDDIEGIETEIKTFRKKLDRAIEEQGKLRVENLAEQRRITDVRVKFNRLLADIDLLVIPRATMFNPVRGDRIPGRIYGLDDAQVEAIKDFMKAGKPVLFCLGPMNEPGENARDEADRDSLEKLLSSFNVQMPNQAILFNSEADAMAEGEDREQLPGGAGQVEVPPAEFEWKFAPGSRGVGEIDIKAEPLIRKSMVLTARGLAEKGRSEMKIRAPRPVYVVRTSWKPETVATTFGALPMSWPAGPTQALLAFATKMNKKLDEKTVFLMTNAECWNEDRPFPNPAEKWIPHFERPKADDPNKGTLRERRRGPFPIGVALEAKVPAEWYDKDAAKKEPATIRLAVIGQGGLFIGDKLSPLKEKLFLDVSNWLLGRDGLLARERESWQYPRVDIDDTNKTLWSWGARLGLPLLFLYIGLNVWLVRRMR